MPTSVQQQHRTDIEYAHLIDTRAWNPIMFTRRVGDVSSSVTRCLRFLDET